MMDKLRTAPLPLKKKLLLTALVGAAFFFVGLAAIFFSRDTITVLLSGILAVGLACKAVAIYHLIITARYTPPLMAFALPSCRRRSASTAISGS